MNMPEIADIDELVGVAEVSGAEVTISRHFPRVGDTLVFKHECKRSSHGDFVGYRRTDRKDHAKITAVYIGGMVRVGHTEVWACEYAGENRTGSTWHTVAASVDY